MSLIAYCLPLLYYIVMKPLSLERPLVIMTVGLPGSGKSFFARQFSDMFSAPLISKDEIRTTLFPGSSYAKDEDIYVSKIADINFRELLKTQRTIIYDGDFAAVKNRREVAKFAKERDYSTMLIWVQTDDTTCRQRSLRRSKRKSGDTYNNPMTNEVYEQYAKRFTQPSQHDRVVVISGKHTFSSQARVVLKQLVSPQNSGKDQRADAQRRTSIQIN